MTHDMRQQVAEYNELVKQYHALDEAIDTLLMKYDGHSENMPESAIKQYRDLARQRDDVFNNMRMMEQTLFTENDDE